MLGTYWNLRYVFSINEFFTISFFKINSQPLSFFQRNEHVEIMHLYDNKRLSILHFWQFILRFFMGVYCQIANCVVVLDQEAFHGHSMTGTV